MDVREDTHVYAPGIITCSACLPKGLDRGEVARRVNLVNPTGITVGWRVSSDTQFRTGQSMPCACESDPDREHWLLEC